MGQENKFNSMGNQDYFLLPHWQIIIIIIFC